MPDGQMTERFEELTNSGATIKSPSDFKKMRNESDYLIFCFHFQKLEDRDIDDYLCNKYDLQSIYNSIGDVEIHKEPVLEVSNTITAVTMTTVNGKIVAFFGTAYGHILKVSIVRHKATQICIKKR